MNKSVVVFCVWLSGCVAYPHSAPGPDPYQAQAAADAQCAKSGKNAVKTEPVSCNVANCTTTF